MVFIHSSIKTRIETIDKLEGAKNEFQFLYIVPLKQGLKQKVIEYLQSQKKEFLYIVPLKQGLKQK